MCWITEKAREFQKNINFYVIDYAKAFDCMDHNKLENSWRDGNTRPLYLFLEKPVCGSRSNNWTGHGTTDWFKIGKGVWQDCILSLCLSNFYVEYIMRNAKLDESQIGIKIDRRNINNLRCADDTTLNGRKWRGTKVPLDEGEWGEWKNWLKTQHSRN